MSKYRITLEGKTYEMEVELVNENNVLPSIVKKENKVFNDVAEPPVIQSMGSSVAEITGSNGIVLSPMPGTVISINKAEGNAVKAGETVLILEAMKMENEIFAPVDGTIIKINCTAGKSVTSGEVLFEVQ